MALADGAVFEPTAGTAGFGAFCAAAGKGAATDPEAAGAGERTVAEAPAFVTGALGGSGGVETAMSGRTAGAP